MGPGGYLLNAVPCLPVGGVAECSHSSYSSIVVLLGLCSLGEGGGPSALPLSSGNFTGLSCVCLVGFLVREIGVGNDLCHHLDVIPRLMD